MNSGWLRHLAREHVIASFGSDSRGLRVGGDGKYRGSRVLLYQPRFTEAAALTRNLPMMFPSRTSIVNTILNLCHDLEKGRHIQSFLDFVLAVRFVGHDTELL